MLGPVLICHKKDEKAVKLSCDTLLDASPGLAIGIKVLGVDGENSILNQTCNAFPCSVLKMLKRTSNKISQKLYLKTNEITF